MKNKVKQSFMKIALPLTSVALLGACGMTDSEITGGNEEEVITVMASGVSEGQQGIFLNNFKNYVEDKHPEYSVEITLLPDDQYNTTLNTRLTTGGAPDLILVQPKKASANSVEGLAEAGYLEDLSDLENWDSIADSAKEDMSYEGNPYAISSSIGALGTWYNKDLFEKNNIEIPSNWEEFLEASEIIAKSGITPIVMGDKDSYMIQFGMYQVAANQVYPNNPQFDDQLYTGETSFTDPEWVKTISMYYELYDNGFVDSNSLGLGQPQAQQNFLDQQAAMIFDGDFSYSVFENADFELGFMALPANETGETYTAAATNAGYAITSTSEHKEFLKGIFNTMTDGESELFEGWVSGATTLSTYEGYEPDNPIFDDIRDIYSDGRGFYWANQAWPSGTETEMQVKFSEMIESGNITAEEVAEAMQQKFEELSQ